MSSVGNLLISCKRLFARAFKLLKLLKYLSLLIKDLYRGPNIFIAFKISLYIEFLVDAWDIAGAYFTLT